MDVEVGEGAGRIVGEIDGSEVEVLTVVPVVSACCIF